MNRILLVCLLGIALLWNNSATAEKATTVTRIVDCQIEGHILIASSQQEDGVIIKVQIFNSSNELQFEESCSGYVCYVDLSGLHSGVYTAKVITTNTVYTWGFRRY
ncbi:MAG: hypothetical protein KIS94_13585 [Chitinophagales bacterium]|nr:hypothetical protein [Chitinophagales bacterium]